MLRFLLTVVFPIIGGTAIGIAFVLALILFLEGIFRRRRRRKALVSAALDVINQYRRTANKPYPVSQFKDRCDLAVVMERLIDATKYVN